MIPYWFLFSIPAFVAQFERPRRAMQQDAAKGLLLAALYFVPIQLFVLSRLPDVFGHTQPTREVFVF